jgi:hypothetical protein
LCEVIGAGSGNHTGYEDAPALDLFHDNRDVGVLNEPFGSFRQDVAKLFGRQTGGVDVL